MKTVLSQACLIFLFCFFGLFDALKALPAKDEKNAGIPSFDSPGMDARMNRPAGNEMLNNHLVSRTLRFTENKGQMIDLDQKPLQAVLFKAEMSGMNVYITKKGISYVFSHAKGERAKLKKANDPQRMLPMLDGDSRTLEMAWVHVHLDGASIDPARVLKEGKSREHTNYFNSNCPDGIYGVHSYEKITLKDVYPGIDWVVYSSSKSGMKYDFVVHPGADPSLIKLVYESDQAPELLQDGSISISTPLGSIAEARPFSYEASSASEIESSFKLTALDKNKTLLQFQLGHYNSEQTLVIDPELNWLTFFGGDVWDECFSTTTDSDGNVYLVGYTQSTNLPVQNPGSGAYFMSGPTGLPESDIFLLKFSSNGVLLWSTYYSGANMDLPYSVVADATGAIYVSGVTRSNNFPVQALGGSAFFQLNFGGDHDVFILKFNAGGVRQWATYYGGTGWDGAFTLSIDNGGNLLVAGKTESPNFPTQNAGGYYQGTLSGTADGFILKFDNNSSRTWATYYGGSDLDEAHSIAADASGNIFVAGETSSTDFPTQSNGGFFQSSYAGLGDLFVLKFSPSANRLWATYYGGSANDLQSSLAIDSQGHLYIMGMTESLNLPVQDAGTFFQATLNGGLTDLYFLKFDNDGNRLWATYFGGNVNFDSFWTFDAIELDDCDNLYFFLVTDDFSFPHLVNNVNSGFHDNMASASTIANEFLLGRFSNAGVLQWCSYLGGSGSEQRTSIAWDKGRHFIYAVGSTIPVFGIPYLPSNFPITNPGGGAYFDNTIDPNGGDGYELVIAKFSIPDPTVSGVSTDASGCSACDGSASVTIIPGEGAFSYQWSNGFSETNVSTLTSSIANLCTGNYSVVVSAGCSVHDTLTFAISSPNGVATSTILNASSCDSYTSPWGTVYTQSGTYSDTLTSVGGCDSILVVNLSLTAGVLAEENISSCGPYTAPGGTVYNQSTSFSSSFTLPNGCDSVVSYNITIHPEATVSIDGPEEITIIRGDSVGLNASGADSYQWTPAGGLSCTNCPTPMAAPQTSGTWVVTTTNAFGCTASDSIRITVDIFCNDLFIPTIFSPNNNGSPENEKLCIYGDCIKSMELGIYNRWGELIFRTNEQKTCWDGTHKGIPAMAGVYAYRLYVDFEDGRRTEKAGTITLTR